MVCAGSSRCIDPVGSDQISFVGEIPLLRKRPVSIHGYTVTGPHVAIDESFVVYEISSPGLNLQNPALLESENKAESYCSQSGDGNRDGLVLLIYLHVPSSHKGLTSG